MEALGIVRMFQYKKRYQSLLKEKIERKCQEKMNFKKSGFVEVEQESLKLIR